MFLFIDDLHVIEMMKRLRGGLWDIAESGRRRRLRVWAGWDCIWAIVPVKMGGMFGENRRCSPGSVAHVKK